MQIYSLTDKGVVRHSNQDSFAAGAYNDNDCWAVVCDGMGGASGGNVASSTAVKIISESLVNSYRNNMSDSSIKNMMASALNAANIAIYDISRENNELAGMGTTVVVSVIINNKIYICHAGDSRAYYINNDEIFQITKDHSVVQKMIESGRLSVEEARNHPSKNVITRVLGVDEIVEIDYNELDMLDNSYLLLCTDGLTNFVDQLKIKSIILTEKDNNITQMLIDSANQNGGGDNITAIVISNIVKN